MASAASERHFVLCGRYRWEILTSDGWPQSNLTSVDLGFCFEQLCLQLPSQLGFLLALLAVALRLDFGGDAATAVSERPLLAEPQWSDGRDASRPQQRWHPLLRLRALLASVLLLGNTARLGSLVYFGAVRAELPAFINSALGIMLWFTAAIANALHASQPAAGSRHRPRRCLATTRYPLLALVPLLCLVTVAFLESRSLQQQPERLPLPQQQVAVIVHFIILVPLFFYALTQTPAPRLAAKKPPGGPSRTGGYQTFSSIEPQHSTVGSGGLLSDLLFLWLAPLMQRAVDAAAAAAGSADDYAGGGIEGPDDLPELPSPLLVASVEHRIGLDDPRLGCRGAFAQQLRSGVSINEDALTESADELTGPARVAVITQPWRCAEAPPKPPLARRPLLALLRAAFGIEYAGLGALKLFADTCAFCGPLALNWFVGFLEATPEQRGPDWWGGVYVAALVASSLLAAAASTAFNYRIGLLVLKARCALVSLVYRKTLSVPVSALGQYSSGQTLNFMSTDADRIVNFCPSFHQLWSMPLQIVVVTAMLWYQVGWVCVVGLAFTLLLLPVNRLIALKIEQQSAVMMKHKDRRVKLTGEVLRGIRPVKLWAWEDAMRRRIRDHRSRELRALKWRKYLDALCVYFWAATPVAISLLTFVAYALLGNQLTAAKAFTCIALFGMLITPLNALPWVVNGLMEARVSLRRVDSFLRCREMPPQSAEGVAWSDSHIELFGASFAWKEAEQKQPRPEEDSSAEFFCLHELTLKIARGQFIGIVGPVGSGKSSLLLAVQRELRKLSGDLRHSELLHCGEGGEGGGIAYVAQEPWLQRGSVQDNIVFGAELEPDWLSAVVRACGLQADLPDLPCGLLTEVGEGGQALSGGQRARVALARAVYQRAQVYLLDDPLASVDARTASRLVERCFLGLLRDRTRVLVTHRTGYLAGADWIFVLADGRVVDAGPPDRVLGSRVQHVPENFQPDGAVAAAAAADTDVDADTDIGDDPETGESGLRLHRRRRRATTLEDDGGEADEQIRLTDGPAETAANPTADAEAADGAADAEAREFGSVDSAVYLAYAHSVGWLLAALVLISLLLMQGSRNASDLWLAAWTGNRTRRSTEFYLAVYGGLAGANSVFTLARALLFALGGLRAARLVHKQLLLSVLRAPVQFFDSCPLGRLVNRFSSDLYTVDDTLPFQLNILLAQAFGLAGTLAVICLSLPAVLLLLLPLACCYWSVQDRYRAVSRELKRINSVALSPMYSHYLETLAGLPVIRGHGRQPRFLALNRRHLSRFIRAGYSATAVSAWLQLRLQLLGVAVVAGVVTVAMATELLDSADAGLVGLASAYAMGITGALNGVVTYATETEKEMVAMERLLEYSVALPNEEASHGSQAHPQIFYPSWPRSGSLEFSNVSLRYRPAPAPRALSHVTFSVAPGDRLAIVGRTGSGKTSLLRALFRTVELDAGCVKVDGLDIRRLARAHIRSRLAVIPQEPFLFDASLRENLDPAGEFSYEELEAAIDSCRLRGLEARLSARHGGRVGEAGRCLSAGQRQLVCLARAILRRAPLVCLDEATASVDADTEAEMQQALLRCLSGVTLLVIAHRLETVAALCNSVIVLSGGRIVEQGCPEELLRNPRSELYRLFSTDTRRRSGRRPSSSAAD